MSNPDSLATHIRQIAARRPADATELMEIAVRVAKLEHSLDEIAAEAEENARLTRTHGALRVVRGGKV